jgi:hypothetical protein
MTVAELAIGPGMTIDEVECNKGSLGLLRRCVPDGGRDLSRDLARGRNVRPPGTVARLPRGNASLS